MKDDRQSATLLTVTPDDAKAIWDSIVAKSDRPTDRLVADALVQSGRYHPVHFTTIARWRRAGWATIPKRVSGQVARAMSAMQAVDPVAAERAQHMVNDSLALSEIKDRFLGHSDEALMRANARSAAVIGVLRS